MHSAIFSQSDLVAFSSQSPVASGSRFTITEEREERPGKWVMLALLSSGEQEEIYLDTQGINGQSFIVLSSRGTEKAGFSHVAVPVERLVQVTQEIEDNIVDLLQPAREIKA